VEGGRLEVNNSKACFIAKQNYEGGDGLCHGDFLTAYNTFPFSVFAVLYVCFTLQCASDWKLKVFIKQKNGRKFNFFALLKSFIYNCNFNEFFLKPRGESYFVIF
jgi:hypothetical protein